MAYSTARPRLVARAATIALWAVGSAYLLKSELASATPDYVVMASTPVVWAVIIALPILATYARRDGQWLAMALIWMAALVGSAYTLQTTLGRQAESRDIRVSTALASAQQRVSLTASITSAEALLRAAQSNMAVACSTGVGPKCVGNQAIVALYEKTIAANRASIAALDTQEPSAGEKRIARLLTFATGGNPETVSEIVGLVLPAMFGLTLELAAFAVALMGWHPSNPPTPPGKRAPLPANVVELRPGKHPVIDALERAGRPVNNGELAKLMAVCDGEATKRRREVASLLVERRAGKHCMIALRATA